jgi:hypothetical protein
VHHHAYTVEVAAALNMDTGSELTSNTKESESGLDGLDVASRDIFNRIIFVFLFTSYGLGDFSIQTQIR